MFRDRLAKFILLTFFGFGLTALSSCANEYPREDSIPGSTLVAPDSRTTRSPVVAVTTTLKDSHAGPIAGRRFALETEGGKTVRSLTDARGRLSLRLTPNTNYTLRPMTGEASDSDALLKLAVDSDGQVSVTESRRLYANDLQAIPSNSQEADANAAKFQSARFGESVFAP